MGVYAIPQALEEKLGRPAAEALAEMVGRMMEDERRDVLARIDERVVGRYNDIQRRSHEDVAGVEIRLTNKMGELESRLTDKMGVLESRLNDKMGALETRLETRLTGGMSELRKEMADVRVELRGEIGDAKHTMLVWFVSSVVVQAGFMTLIAWASKHIF